jgi:rSAM/selenodomain-associated transferase 1
MTRLPTIVVFCREPIPGETKTRLVPRVGVANAAAIAGAFTQDALAKAQATGARIAIAGSGPRGAGGSRYFRALARRFDASLVEQGEGTLGMRMERALVPFLPGAAVLIGTDTPSIPARLLRRSLALLRRAPVVIGPSLDGGYYLVGVRGAMPDIFRGIRWGGPRVLEQTLIRLRRTGSRYALGPSWYDIDRWSDLMLLAAHLRQSATPTANPCPATARALRRLGLL